MMIIFSLIIDLVSLSINFQNSKNLILVKKKKVEQN